MLVSATVTSKGQITLPKPLRDALHIKEGDVIDFRIELDHAVLIRPQHFLDLAGSVEMPAELKNRTWSEIIDRAHGGRSSE
ncbi:unannotated protein [freshwater metagenome]|uniref:Unannotated protein n=1 Tax=freshwater metagenome TaxID=449393 RepID=A0A6J6FPL5_9ZZZZ